MSVWWGKDHSEDDGRSLPHMETRDHSEFRGIIPFGEARSTKTILGGVCLSL